MGFAALVASSAIVLGYIAWVTRGQLASSAQAIIEAERSGISQTYAREGIKGARSLVANDLRVPGPLVVMIQGKDGAILAGNLQHWPESLVADGRYWRSRLTRTGALRSEPFAMIASRLAGGARLLVGRSLEEEERLTATLTTSMIGAVGLAVVLAGTISLVLTRMIDERVQRIADVASAVAGGDLSRRVEVDADSWREGDAFDRMGVALNAMLARIESLLDELRALTDGLAHDLRSPLTRMKARIDRMARADLISGSDVLAVGAEADALLAMLDNSLEITRIEAGIGRENFADLDLAALVTDLAEMYEPLAEDNGVRLTANAPEKVPILAHRELLGRAVSNLIDNALRYGSSGGSIEVSAVTTDEGTQLTVADNGPGIAITNREDALRRFGRLDTARSVNGAGLGLSLAAAIARLHGGRLTLAGNNPGLRVIIDMPTNIAH